MFRTAGAALILSVFSLQVNAYTSADIMGLYHFNEGSGTTVYDSSGNGRNGTISGTVSWVTGISGTALHFDGSSTVCRLGRFFYAPIDSQRADFSVVAWTRTTSATGSGTRQEIISKGDPQNSGYSLSSNNSQATALVGACGDNGWAPSTAKIITDGSWHQEVVVRSQNTVYVYTDATLQYSYNPGTGGSEIYDTLFFGRHGTKVLDWYNGDLDEVMILKTALSSSDIVNLYNSMLQLPQSPALSLPSNGSQNQPLALTVSWGSQPGAQSYGVQVSAAADFSTTIFGQASLASTQQTISGLTNNTTYYWRASAAYTGGTILWSSEWSFTTVPPVPAAPVLSGPQSGTQNLPLSSTLSWLASASATSYGLQVSTSSTFTPAVINQTGISGNGIVYSALSSSTLYYWHVNATNSSGTGSWSGTWSFTTIMQAPATPTLVSPVNGSSNQPVTLTLSWNTSMTATSYSIQVSANSTFSSLITVGSGLTGTSSTMIQLAYGTIFYWRISASNAGGTSSWSSAWMFTTGAQTGTHPCTFDAPANFDFYPVSANPFRSSIAMAFDVPAINNVSQHRVEIAVYDIKGRLVMQLARGMYAAGHHTLVWNGPGRGFDATVYILSMRSEQFNKQLKIVRLGS